MEETIQMSAKEVLQRLHADDSGNSCDEDENATPIEQLFRPSLRMEKATIRLVHLLLHTLMVAVIN